MRKYIVALMMLYCMIAICAAAQDVEHLYHFGRCLGMAFQIQDDLLDAYGNSDTFGKTIGGDIVTNKKTFLLVNALKTANSTQRKELEYWLNDKNHSPEEKIAHVLDIYEQNNVRETAKRTINGYFEQAAEELSAVTLADERKEELRNFAHQLINREK